VSPLRFRVSSDLNEEVGLNPNHSRHRNLLPRVLPRAGLGRWTLRGGCVGKTRGSFLGAAWFEVARRAGTRPGGCRGCRREMRFLLWLPSSTVSIPVSSQPPRAAPGAPLALPHPACTCSYPGTQTCIGVGSELRVTAQVLAPSGAWT